MTKIIFDIKRDNGYGKLVNIFGNLNWNASQQSVNLADVKPAMSVQISGGPVQFEVEPTDETFFWTVTETSITSGGTGVTYQRNVSVPNSDTPIDFLDLPDVDPNTFFPNPEIV